MDVFAGLASKGQPALGPDGEVLHIDGVGSDVTERRVAEFALQMSEQRYDLAMEAAADGLYDWNVSTGEVFFNPRWFLMLGYEPHEFPHVIDTWKLLVHPEDLDRAMAEQREQMALNGGLLSSSGCARRAANTDGYCPVERSPNATRMALPCPDGIAGSNIPLCARVMAVSDVYDTLTSRRCYKEPMPHDVAAGILLQDAGTHFDADIVQAFLLVEQVIRSSPRGPWELTLTFDRTLRLHIHKNQNLKIPAGSGKVRWRLGRPRLEGVFRAWPLVGQ